MADEEATKLLSTMEEPRLPETKAKGGGEVAWQDGMNVTTLESDATAANSSCSSCAIRCAILAVLAIMVAAFTLSRPRTDISQWSGCPDSEHNATEPRHAIHIVCAPADWFCSSGLARRIAARLTSDSRTPFSFTTKDEPSRCHARIYFRGNPGFPRRSSSSSDLRVFINAEPTSVFEGDLTISGVRDLPLKMGAWESTAVVYLPYLFFAVLQGKETDDHALIANSASQLVGGGSRLFAAYATSHCGEEARHRFYSVLSEYKPLHYLNHECGNGSAPPPERTISDRSDESSWVDSITRRFSHYKFAVVFENAIRPGYHTEKLALARKAGAVPVYYGSHHIHTLFNSSSFIDCSPRPHESEEVAFQRCKEQIIAVDKDDNEWRKIVTAPFLKDNRLLNYGPLARLLRAMVCSKTNFYPNFCRPEALETPCSVLRGDGDMVQQAALKMQPSVADRYFVPADGSSVQNGCRGSVNYL